MYSTGIYESNETVVDFLRERDTRLVIYLDNILILSKDPAKLSISCLFLGNYFRNWGW